MSKRTPMLEQYFSIKEQHQHAVLFFHMGDFYEMFGDDAVEASKILDLTLTARGKGTENEIAMCGVPIHAAPGYIAQLTRAGKKVAICDQVTPPGNGLVQREVTRIVTPGTSFDESTLKQDQNQYLCSLVKSEDQFAVATLDVTTGSFHVGLFDDLQQVKEELFRLQPSEVLVTKNDELAAASLPSSLYLTVSSLEAWQQVDKILEEHFQTLGLAGFGLDQEPALQKAAAVVLRYVQETQKSALQHIRGIEIQQQGESMLLDEATIRNLELFSTQPSFAKASEGEQNSLYGVLNRTETGMGARLLRWWVTHPLIKADPIQARQQAISFFVDQAQERTEVQQLLASICDLERLVGKLGTLRANPRDLFNLKETLTIIPDIKAVLVKADSPLLKELDAQLSEEKKLINDISSNLVDEPPISLQDGGVIQEGVSADLDELRQLSTSGKEWISRMQEEERQKTGITSLKVKYNRVFGYYIEVSKSNLASVPETYIRKQTLVNAERFITPELKEYEEKILGAQEKILQLEEELFVALRQRCFERIASLQDIAKALAQLDVLSSLARIAVERRYVRPQLIEDDCLVIKQGRHPVIEQLQSEPYVANDTVLKDDQIFSLLTGPNMSGKSSYLRQTALIVLMAQMGSFVPASEMQWHMVDRIFTRVGASDNLVRGRSTFMVEMQEAAYILQNATKDSLVILDELGRGTSTYDGLSLAWAITEYLHDIIGAKTLFATHYHELIEVVDGLEKAKNYSVAVAEDGDGVVFLHQVLEGGINKSYGIEVAKLAGLPHQLILRSKDVLSSLEKHQWQQGSEQRQKTLPLMPVAKPSDHPVVKKLKEVDPNQVTPLQALQLLMEWKNEID